MYHGQEGATQTQVYEGEREGMSREKKIEVLDGYSG